MSTRSVYQRFSFVSLLIILSLLLPVGNPPVLSGHSTQVTMSPADETLYMDMRLSQNATVGSSALVIGASYLLRISGTWSAWSPNTWSSYCGAAEDAPVIPSPGVTNGKVGVDAEYVFAAPNGYGICGRPGGPPWYNRGPEISLDGGSTWREATPIDKNYHSDHKYEYLVIGQGYPIRIRFVDSPNSDNYGILPVTVTSITCSGYVTDGAGAGITGVTVSAGAAGSATTDGSGVYTLSGLAAGTYTLTPSKSGYTFSPDSRTVTVPPSATGVDFTAAPITYTAAGRITDAAGTAVANVTISDGAGHTATTGSDGNYLLTGLVAGTHTLTPSKIGYTFSPASRAVTVSPDATGQDFTGATSLQGPLTLVPVVPLANEESPIMQGGWVHRHFRIRDATGAAAASVTVTFAPTGVGTSDAAGLLDVAIYADSLGGLGGYGLSVTEASRWGTSFALSAPVSFVVRVERRELESFWASGAEVRKEAGAGAGLVGYITGAYGGGLEARLTEKYPLANEDDILKLKSDETMEAGIGARPEVSFELGPVKGDLGVGPGAELTWKALKEFTSEFNAPYTVEQQKAEAITALVGVYRTQLGFSQLDPMSHFLGQTLLGQIILRLLEQNPSYQAHLVEDTGGIGVSLKSSFDVGGKFDFLKFGKYSRGINRSRFLHVEAGRKFDQGLGTLAKWTTDPGTDVIRRLTWQEEAQESAWTGFEAGFSYGTRAKFTREIGNVTSVERVAEYSNTGDLAACRRVVTLRQAGL